MVKSPLEGIGVFVTQEIKRFQFSSRDEHPLRPAIYRLPSHRGAFGGSQRSALRGVKLIVPSLGRRESVQTFRIGGPM